MIKINKKEKEYLQSKGVCIGENGLSGTRSCHRNRRTWYMTETRRNVALLTEYRNKLVISTVE